MIVEDDLTQSKNCSLVYANSAGSIAPQSKHSHAAEPERNCSLWTGRGGVADQQSSCRLNRAGNVRFGSIALQKSKVAGRLIFRENKKQETIADSYDLNRVTEVTCEFKLRR
jgi:hypothetical protein